GSAQPRITSTKAVFTRSSKQPMARRNERLLRKPSSGMIPRGSGDHHARELPEYIGNSPRRYAASKVPGSRSAPTATMSSAPTEESASGKSQTQGGGSTGISPT